MRASIFKHTAIMMALAWSFYSCSEKDMSDIMPEENNDTQLWDYPVKPGTEEWKQFQSNEEKVRACQIPEEVLDSLSTEDLTDLCLRYPLLVDVFAFNFVNMGLDKLFSDFNGIRALYNRETEDVSRILIQRYIHKIQSLSLLDKEDSNLEKFNLIISISVLEVLFSRIELRANESDEILKELLKALVSGYEEEKKYPDYFQFYEPNFFARANLIYKICEQCLEKSLAMNNHFNNEERELINRLSYQLIK